MSFKTFCLGGCQRCVFNVNPQFPETILTACTHGLFAEETRIDDQLAGAHSHQI